MSVAGPATVGTALKVKPFTVVLALLALAFVVFFTALGFWQMERRTWKLALIERVETRVQAPPTSAPAQAEWPQVTAATHEYRHVSLSGRYLAGRDVFVQAVTARGTGFWLLAPLQLADGSVVLVNRGLVPRALPPSPASAKLTTGEAVAVTGLLRLSEPGGAFLRHNDPAAERWFSRDVTAMATARQLDRVAPYFVDADATPGASDQPQQDVPVGGLTVIAFHNNHLMYAITWFALALMVAGAAIYTAVHNARRHEPEPAALPGH